MAWAAERADGNGRGFGFTGAHFHRNWQNDDFRKLVLNAIAWTAHAEVPQGRPREPDSDRRAAGAEPRSEGTAEEGGCSPCRLAGPGRWSAGDEGSRIDRHCLDEVRRARRHARRRHHRSEAALSRRDRRRRRFRLRLGGLGRTAAGRPRGREEADRTEVEVRHKRLRPADRRTELQRRTADHQRQDG